MLFSVSQENINDIISSTFPTSDYIVFNSVIIDNNGPSNTSIKLSLMLQDNISALKVFGNLTAKKMMFLKLFEISSQQMQEQLVNVKNIQQLNKLLQENNVFYKNLNAALSFIGDTKDVYQHFTSDNKVFLNYNFNFILPKKDPQYLSFGAVFYYDTDLYSEENKVPKEFISYETIFGQIKTINVINNFSPNSPVLKDLRILKDIFTVEKLYQQITLKTTGPKLLSSKVKKIPYNQFFSNLYITKKSKDSCGILFNLDYHKLIFEYSPVKDVIFRSQDIDSLLNKSYISNIRVKRRLVKKHNNSFIDVNKQSDKIIETSDDDNLLLKSVNTDAGSVEELILDTNSDLKLRSIVAEDKKVFSNKKGYYQYGVELKIVDGVIEYLRDVSKILSEDNSLLVKYLSETDKAISTSRKLYDANPHSAANNSAMAGFYDPLAGKFTAYFMYVYFPRNYSDKLLDVIGRFINTLNLFGFIKTDVEKIRSVFVSFINPAFATAQTIQYIINMHSRLIGQINKILNDAYNNNYSLEHWFENDALEIDNKSEYGYKFINIQDNSIFGKADSDYINIRTEEEILKYSSKPDISGSQLTSKYSYLSPMEVLLEKNSLDLEQLKIDKNNIPLEDYKGAELEIKRYNLLKEKDKEVVTSNKITAFTQDEQREILKNNRLFSDDSILIDITDSLADEISGSDYILKKDIDPTMLYLGLSKYAVKQKELKNDSLHMQLLIENSSRYFQNPDEQNIFLKDLDLNSKYNILYNTIHKIEFLSYDQNVKKEIWSVFDQRVYLDLENKKTILCRITPTNVDTYSNISLPIYNKYFVLTYKQESPVSFRKPEDQLEDFVRPDFTFPDPPPEPDPVPEVQSIPEPNDPVPGPIVVTSFVSSQPTFTSEPLPPPPPPPIKTPPTVSGLAKPVEGDTEDAFFGKMLANNTRYSLHNNQAVAFAREPKGFGNVLLKSQNGKYTLYGHRNRMILVEGDPNDPNIGFKVLWQMDETGNLPKDEEKESAAKYRNNVWEMINKDKYPDGSLFLAVKNNYVSIYTKRKKDGKYRPIITLGSSYNPSEILNGSTINMPVVLQLLDNGQLEVKLSGLVLWRTNTANGRISNGPKDFDFYGDGSTVLITFDEQN